MSTHENQYFLSLTFYVSSLAYYPSLPTQLCHYIRHRHVGMIMPFPLPASSLSQGLSPNIPLHVCQVLVLLQLA